MLQDLDFGHLDNQYREKFPQAHDRVLCMHGGEILIGRDADNHLHIPTWQQVQAACADWHRWHSSMKSFRGIKTGLQKTDEVCLDIKR